MKASELREKTIAQLQDELTELLKVQFGLRMQHATGQLAKSSSLRVVRRNIARLKTVLKQKMNGG